MNFTIYLGHQKEEMRLVLKYYIMKKVLPFIALFFISGLAMAQSDGYKWALFSEIAPYANATPAMHEDNFYSHNISWRNRVGFHAGKNTILGFMGSYRAYENLENRTFENMIETGKFGIGYNYRFQTRNSLLGGGVFATQLFPIGKKIAFQLNYYALIEQGTGEVNRIHESISFIGGIPRLVPPILMPDSYDYRERNINTGLDIGLSYYLQSNLAIQGNVRLIQLENFNFKPSETNRFGEESSHNLNINQKGTRFNHLFNMPVAHIGISYHFGRR
ncbi:hypothetical protein KI659_14795 [Litoribacter alkaliphilus]|uniref:Uncharacterized protein n=1 Tax=Litoribacter ruber TaxID=702568 RepID=A0AAP2CKB9_9BACT|nr:hypothetical protein [Litoribacter alkaliphilus]MBS9525284.1 hypothetical protein [Litoribacter alkaliphilus]